MEAGGLILVVGKKGEGEIDEFGWRAGEDGGKWGLGLPYI